MKNLRFILIVVVITAIVVGAAVYYWPNRFVADEEIEAQPAVEIEIETQPAVEVDEEIVVEVPSTVYNLISPENSEFYGPLSYREHLWTGEAKQLYLYKRDKEDWYGFYVYTDLDGIPLSMPTDLNVGGAFRSALSESERFLAYVQYDGFKIMVYDFDNGTSHELMSVFDDTDGVDYFWSPNDDVLAVVVVNQINESYRSTSGTKLFLLTLDEGELLKKDRHLFKIRYECHDAGCNTSSDDVYFKDEHTLVYRTWESETPYEDAGDDSLLRILEF